MPRLGDPICPGLLACSLAAMRPPTETWLAWSQRHWSHVVVRLPDREHVGDPRVRRQLGREAATLARLRHPAVRRLLADGHRDALPHLVLEHVGEPDLGALLGEEGPLAPGDVVRLGIQLASCLHFAHVRGLVHLDIRPANVALRDGRAVLLDFHLVTPVGSKPAAERPSGIRSHRGPGSCVVTPADPRTDDLFALGVLLHEAATGRPPGESPGQARRQGRARAGAVRSRWAGPEPSLPADLALVIRSLLGSAHGRRPEGARSALRLLAAALPPDEEPAWPPYVDQLLEGDA